MKHLVLFFILLFPISDACALDINSFYKIADDVQSLEKGASVTLEIGGSVVVIKNDGEKFGTYTISQGGAEPSLGKITKPQKIIVGKQKLFLIYQKGKVYYAEEK